MRKNVRISRAALIGLVASSALVLPALAFADTTPAPTQSGWNDQQGSGMRAHPGVFGTVTTINGTTLTVTQKARHMQTGTTAPAPVTYTVDASGATVNKNNVASTLSAVAVNDVVMVQGTITGTNVVATAIRDGVPMSGPRGGGMGNGTPSLIKGNGQPVIGGTVSAVNGTSLTITNASNVTYTVDITSAVIEKAGKAGVATDITTGDAVVVQGAVSGTTVTASSVMDHGVVPSTASAGSPQGGMHGFMDGIGGFFKKLFGF